MKNVKAKILIIFIFVSSCSFGQLYTEYATSTTLDSLVVNMFSSPSVQIFNVTYTADYNSYTDNIKDLGFFNSLNSTVGIDSGIILTGGWLEPPYGLGEPAYNVSSSDFKSTNGDSILDSIIAPSKTLGAVILEFDFIPNGDTLKFNYVFASDEYPYQICHPDNDVFAFHISGAGIQGIKNIALVPNTDIPVGNNSINNVALNPYSNQMNTDLCQSIDYPQYYVDHTSDQTFIFNGSTTVLTAKVATVPCETYHLRFAISNGGNNTDESPAVFLEANSFNSEPLKIESSVSYGGNDTVLYEGCGYAEIVVRRTYNIQEPKVYNISITGTAENGIDYEYLSDTVSMIGGQMYDTLKIYPISDYIVDNNETIIISIGDTLCNGVYYTTDIELIIIEKPPFETEIIDNRKNKCDTAIFSTIITGAIEPIEYHWNINNSTDSIISFYPNYSNYDTLTPISVIVYDACGNSSYDSTNIIFAKYPIASFTFPDYYYDRFDSEVYFTNHSSENSTYWLWNFGYYSYASISENAKFEYKDIGLYNVSLKAYNKYHCYDSLSKEVLIHEYPIIYIPDAFTPDYDGINDKFEIKGTEIIEYELLIFDRRGEKIFISKSINDSWDGKINGELIQEGVYVYILKVKHSNNKITTRTGNINLIR